MSAVIKGIMLRFASNEQRQRDAVLAALIRLTLAICKEIAESLSLSEECVQTILDDFTSADKELAFITTMDGKRKAGRRGTTLHYGLNPVR